MGSCLLEPGNDELAAKLGLRLTAQRPLPGIRGYLRRHHHLRMPGANG
ncbi:hypothetical protein [Allorhizocola rhizosphaerae]|nr:hypothetical protein [Allorhizocola rhizosphaerae]